ADAADWPCMFHRFLRYSDRVPITTTPDRVIVACVLRQLRKIAKYFTVRPDFSIVFDFKEWLWVCPFRVLR
ncbi:hypothetical protein OZK63_42085, partial [Streptomyces sp. UMAF16]|nr:hypothetical protein [Streptomyces sp. UMAF16]